MPLIQPATATTSGYTLATFTLATSIDPVLAGIEYTFQRKILWTTVANTFLDEGFETMPQQYVEAYEFVIRREFASQTEIAGIESFLDAHFGAAVPFTFTAPDDALVYGVTFKDDKIQYSAPNADTRSLQFTLITAGDLANALDNSLVYPSYVTQVTGP